MAASYTETFTLNYKPVIINIPLGRDTNGLRNTITTNLTTAPTPRVPARDLVPLKYRKAGLGLEFSSLTAKATLTTSTSSELAALAGDIIGIDIGTGIQRSVYGPTVTVETVSLTSTITNNLTSITITAVAPVEGDWLDDDALILSLNNALTSVPQGGAIEWEVLGELTPPEFDDEVSYTGENAIVISPTLSECTLTSSDPNCPPSDLLAALQAKIAELADPCLTSEQAQNISEEIDNIIAQIQSQCPDLQFSYSATRNFNIYPTNANWAVGGGTLEFTGSIEGRAIGLNADVSLLYQPDNVDSLHVMQDGDSIQASLEGDIRVDFMNSFHYITDASGEVVCTMDNGSASKRVDVQADMRNARCDGANAIIPKIPTRPPSGPNGTCNYTDEQRQAAVDQADLDLDGVTNEELLTGAAASVLTIQAQDFGGSDDPCSSGGYIGTRTPPNPE